MYLDFSFIAEIIIALALHLQPRHQRTTVHVRAMDDNHLELFQF